MSNAKHTSGPWEVLSRQPTFIRANSGKRHVANTDSMGDEETNKANARLIAAAPDLMEALKAMVICFERFEDTHTALVMDDARAALAKATGASK